MRTLFEWPDSLTVRFVKAFLEDNWHYTQRKERKQDRRAKELIKDQARALREKEQIRQAMLKEQMDAEKAAKKNKLEPPRPRPQVQQPATKLVLLRLPPATKTNKPSLRQPRDSRAVTNNNPPPR